MTMIFLLFLIGLTLFCSWSLSGYIAALLGRYFLPENHPIRIDNREEAKYATLCGPVALVLIVGAIIIHKTIGRRPLQRLGDFFYSHFDQQSKPVKNK
jgi:hypothetical protein